MGVVSVYPSISATSSVHPSFDFLIATSQGPARDEGFVQEAPPRAIVTLSPVLSRV
jgi:hypothetical protein